MIRRKFLGLITLAGAGGAVTLSAARSVTEKKMVTYKIEGFTCATCAVGLETLLIRERGVLAARATYPESVATVTYNAKTISEAAIMQTIESMGFRAHPLQSTLAR